MENVTENPQGQPQADRQQAEISVMDRLERDMLGTAPEPEKEPEVETPHDGFKDEPEKEKPAEEKPEKPEKPEETVEFKFEDEPSKPEEGSWKEYFSEFEIEVPEDYSEEKGFELLKTKLDEKYNQKIEEAKTFRIDDILADFPAERQAEAKLALDLLRSGQSLDKINEPLLNIQKMRSLTPEQLVRMSYEGLEGWDQDMVDKRMETLAQTNQLDTEYKIALNYLDSQEKRIANDKQEYLKQYNTQQQAIREQKKQQEASAFKAALDREKTFLDTPLSDSNKGTILQEFQNGYKEKLLNDPVKLAKFMLYDKYGQKGLEFIQTRALEKARLEVAKKQHNVPQDVAPKGGGRAVNQNNYKTGMDRLEAEHSQT